MRIPRAVYFYKSIAAALTASKEQLNVPSDMVIDEIVIVFLSSAKVVQNQKMSINFKIGTTETLFTDPLPVHSLVGVNNERRFDQFRGIKLKQGEKPEISLTTLEVTGDFYLAIMGTGESK